MVQSIRDACVNRLEIDISGGGVSSLNSLIGAVTLSAGSNITLTPVGNDITIASTGGGGGSPGGVQYDVQLNDGAGGFAGSDNLNFQGGYLTINGDSGYGQLQFLNSPTAAGYAGAGISGIDDQIIVGALAGDMTFWSTQAMNFSADSGASNMMRIGTDGNVYVPGYFLGTGQPAISTNGRVLYNDSGNTAFEWTIGKYTRVDGVVTANLQNTALFDSSGGASSIDWTSRILSNSTNGTAVDWQNRQLVNSIGRVIYDWEADVIYNSAGIASIQPDARILYSVDGTTAQLDWSNTGTTAKINIVNAGVYFASFIVDNSGLVSIDPTSRTLNDVNQGVAIQYATRLLEDINGTAMIDWTGTLNNGAAISFGSATSKLSISYSVADSSGFISLVTNDRKLYYSDGTTVSLDWNVSLFKDTSSVNSLNYGNRVGYDSTGQDSLHWSSRVLYDSNPIGIMSLDWQNRFLINSSGANTLDWENKQLIDGSAVTVDWHNQNLNDSSTIQALAWTTRTLSDATGTKAEDWNNRYLYASDGTSIMVDWAGGRLRDPNASLDWVNRLLFASNGTTKVMDWHTDTTNTFSAIYWFDSGNGDRITGDGSGLTGVAVVADGVTITGDGTSGSPLVAVGGGGGVVNTYNETPSGSINSSNTVFTTAANFTTGKTRIYLNGLRQLLGTDYTETAANQITFATSPITGSSLIADYEDM